MADETVEERLIQATRRYLGQRDDAEPAAVHLDHAVCQDLLISGIDVDDYVETLEEEFGPLVWSIPWLTYTDQKGSYRGCAACIVAPFYLPWVGLNLYVLRRRGFAPRHPRDFPYRLTLRQIADAIKSGGWPEGYWP